MIQKSAALSEPGKNLEIKTPQLKNPLTDKESKKINKLNAKDKRKKKLSN